MSRDATHPTHCQVGYLQIPALDVNASCAFYRSVLGWDTDPTWAGFTAPGVVGQFVTDRAPTSTDGTVLWIAVNRLNTVLDAVIEYGGTIVKTRTPESGLRRQASRRFSRMAAAITAATA
jgi:predicted enzyme related to lactoylglutathione lyase